ncbi:PPOX class F420-dependent oxidoreductase [Candidatus Nanopelagicales bacterium]|jgi:PPOX class probable F420-dependent enzyme|nr:PPOX class F420-dependent oxidoreductase [Candidatus Nanopelagicales bacterium]
MSHPEIERLGTGKYLSLTTFKKDGSAVATPVWVARDGDELVVITDATSGKARRIRNNSSVRLAPCDMRGQVTGSSVDGSAQLTDSTGTKSVAAQVKRKYGLAFSAIGWMEKLRRRSSDSVGIRIRIAETP